MRTTILALLLLAAVSAQGDQPVPRSSRPVFPDDYTTATCAPTGCNTFIAEDFRGAAFRFLGLSVDAAWFQDHHAELLEMMAPYCQKRNTCLATPGNGHMFCDDLISPSMR